MRSAGSLADELSRVNGEIAPLALELYEKRCRKIVEKNKHDYLSARFGACWMLDSILGCGPRRIPGAENQGL